MKIHKINTGPNGFLLTESWGKDASECKVKCSCPARRNMTRIVEVIGTGSDLRKETFNKVVYCRNCGFRLIVPANVQSIKELKTYVEMPD